MTNMRVITDGLRFPEGPVAMPDGSIILTEIEAGRITRVAPDGSKSMVAHTGGGPNGLAVGPDGKLYCCNNGGFDYVEANGFLAPHGIGKDYSGGRIERIDIATGAVEVLYQSGDFGCSLRGPNDIVFDAHGGFWFTDHGKIDYTARCHDVVGIFYAKADGSFLEEVIFPSYNPNGVGLSPDGKTLYAAETYTCRLTAFNVIAPGKVDDAAGPGGPGIPLYRPGGIQVLRFARRRGMRQHLRRHDRRMRHQRGVSDGRTGRIRRDRRRVHHQHLLGRPRPQDRLCDAIGQRATGRDRLGPAGTGARVLRGQS